MENIRESEFKFKRYHWFHMVTVSPWPILLSANALPLVLGFVGYAHGLEYGLELFLLSFVNFLFLLFLWFRDIIRESTFFGAHTKQVEQNTITGFKLFLFTETMLFVTFFWSHLYSALFPSVYCGLSWPPVGMSDLIIDPYGIPLINTAILVYSGFSVTLSHLYLRRGFRMYCCIVMAFSILLGLFFLYFQYEEFTNSDFDISDGIYGSTFFILTGFHGGHVLIGVSFLIITLVRTYKFHFTSSSHTGFKLALIYWHFVDVIWIFVYIIIYVLGSDFTSQNFIYFLDDLSLPYSCVLILDNVFFGDYWSGSAIGKRVFYLFDPSFWLSNYSAFSFPTQSIVSYYSYDYCSELNSTHYNWVSYSYEKSWILLIDQTVWADVFFNISSHIVDDQNTIDLACSQLLVNDLDSLDNTRELDYSYKVQMQDYLIEGSDYVYLDTLSKNITSLFFLTFLNDLNNLNNVNVSSNFVEHLDTTNNIYNNILLAQLDIEYQTIINIYMLQHMQNSGLVNMSWSNYLSMQGDLVNFFTQ